MTSDQKIYNGLPKTLGIFEVPLTEYFTYTYLPIKMPGSSELKYEDRLAPFNPLIGRACCDFIGDYGLDRFVDWYVYISAKHANQRLGQGFNRPGWHSDGFMSQDVSYVWSSKQPTLFNQGPFTLTQDDTLSMMEMMLQVDESRNFHYPNGTLVRMDETVIHRVGDYETGERAFLKLVMSPDVFNLRGNSINHMLDYDWDYIPRRGIRNVPQAHAAAA